MTIEANIQINTSDRWSSHCNQCMKKIIPPSVYRVLAKDLRYVFSMSERKVSVSLSNQILAERIRENYLREIQRMFSDSTPFKQASIVSHSHHREKKNNKKSLGEIFSEKKLLLNKDNIIELEELVYDESRNIFIYGETGNGKTSISKNLAIQFPEWLKITAEAFVQDFANAAKKRDNFCWRNKIRSYRRILLDDFQYLKETAQQSQEELIHLIDMFKLEGKSLIISSSIPLRNLKVASSLKSRLLLFEQIQISAPSLSIRKKIFENECKRLEFLAEQDTIDYLCQKISTNIRSLKSAAQRLKKILPQSHSFFLSPKWDAHFSDLYSTDTGNLEYLVVQMVADYYRINPQDILSSSRKNQIAKARHIIAYICFYHLNMKYREVAQLLKRKQHGTIINACKNIKNQLQEDLFLKDEIATLLHNLRS